MFKIIESDCSNIKLPEDNIELFLNWCNVH